MTINAMENSHCGFFTANDLAMMLGRNKTKDFRALLTKSTKNGTLKRVAKGTYINPNLPPNPKGALYRIAKLIRWDHFIYVSLESQLSHIGVISQIPIGYLSLMTTGRSGTFKTDYGTIEFTHTDRSIESLNKEVYYDDTIGMFRANKDRAMADLRRVGRNTDMIKDEEYAG